MADDERFTEEEVGLILSRAAAAQAGRSMTLAELESAATEAGIDGALVRRAATEVRTQPDTPPVPNAGVFGPTLLVYERRIEGRVDARAWEDIVSEIKRRTKAEGGVEQLGKELVWAARRRNGVGRELQVVVTPRRTHALVRVEERTGGLAGGIYGGIMGGLFPVGLGWVIPVCIAALGVPVLIPFLIALWVYATYLFSRAIYRGALAPRQIELESLANGVAETCREFAALPAASNNTDTGQ
jgi:hypothetical protein